MPMTTIATGPEMMASGVESQGVLSRLEATRQETLRFQFWLGLSRAILVEVVLGAVLILADWMWVLPTAVRALGLAAMAVLAFCLIFRFRRPLDGVDSAVDVEAHFPELGQRLRTVVEYAQPAPDTVPASPGLLRALHWDTDRCCAGLNFRELIPWAAFERRAIALFLTAAFGLIALFLSPGLRTATSRMLLLPRHYTTLRVEPGDLTLKAGNDLKLDATLSGRPVASASWSYRTNDGGGQWINASLAPDRAPGTPAKRLIGTLSASLKNCQTDFDYRVVAGDIESPTFHVKVVHPLILSGLEATVTPPPYTHRPPEVVKKGNFRAIEGSQVQLAVMLDHAPQSAELLVGSAADSSRQSIPLQLDGTRLTAHLPPITKDVEYQIDAIDSEGMKLEGAESYRIKVQLDDKPTIRFIQPDESLAVTPTTEVPIEVEAGDDFGVTRVGIHYKVGDGPEETLHLARPANQPVTAEALAMLYLERHKLSFPDAITYYAFVEDNYPARPHRVVSDLRYIDILPYKHVYKLFDGEEGSSERSLSLEELIARQRVNLSRTFVMERDRSIGDRAVMRLATFEEELAAATADFSDGLRAIGGQIPALDDAVGAMWSATLSLDAKDIPSGRLHEEKALKWLISARRNLQKLLTQNPGQASASRQFDRQQVQKMRRPRRDENQLAELEEDVQELAEREQDFSEEIEARGGGGPKLDPPLPNDARAGSFEEPSSKSSMSNPGSAMGKSSSQGAQSRPDPVQEQKKAAEEAERLKKLARGDKTLTELAIRRLDAAAQSVSESSQSIAAGREAEAAQEARTAARKLESAARQVGALKAKELTERLARQRDLAQAIAKAERELGHALEHTADSKDGDGHDQERLAEKQNELADEVAVLADVLNELEMAAAAEQPDLALSIGRAAKTNPPEEVEESMRKNAGAIRDRHAVEAARSAEHAAGRLDALAEDLESIRRAVVQPRLDRLLAAEKQAAELQERLRSVKDSSQRAGAEKSLSDLARLVDGLASGGGTLREAADHLINATQSSHTGWVRNDKVRPGDSGYFIPPATYTGSLSAAILALQAKIQEIVLDSALVERNSPVPPRYKDLVEDYFRALSQDLR
jgi:Domain of unknown function (DUF4175)